MCVRAQRSSLKQWDEMACALVSALPRVIKVTGGHPAVGGAEAHLKGLLAPTDSALPSLFLDPVRRHLAASFAPVMIHYLDLKVSLRLKGAFFALPGRSLHPQPESKRSWMSTLTSCTKTLQESARLLA